MIGQRTKFEIHVLNGGRWTLLEYHEHEREARHAAKEVLKTEIEGVKIVRDWERGDGMHVEKEVFCEFKAAARSEERLFPGSIDAAPVCSAFEDYFQIDSRTTISRLMRSYLDKHVLTPTEILHNHRELKRLGEYENYLPGSIDRVATLQARQLGVEPRERKDELFRIVERAVRDARDAASRKDLPRLAGGDFATAYGEIQCAGEPEKRDYYALVVLCNRLVRTRNWLGKLTTVLDEIAAGTAPEALRLLDGVMADILATPSVIQDLLGYQPNLAAAMGKLADLAEGAFHAPGREDDDVAIVLNELFANDALPTSRQILLDRVRREIGGAAPLNRHERDKEQAAFGGLLDRLVLEDGVFAGPPMAEALLRRACRLVSHGGAVGRNEALSLLLTLLPGPAARVVYLGELAASPLGEEVRGDIAAHLERLTAGPALNDVVGHAVTGQEAMAAVTRLYHHLLGAAGLAADERDRYAGRLDELMARHLVKENIIQNLDDPKDSLRIRANRLVRFCASGLLTPGKATAMARERVIAHLRRPNFDADYTADIPEPAAKAASIREFFDLLKAAGFD